MNNLLGAGLLAMPSGIASGGLSAVLPVKGEKGEFHERRENEPLTLR